MENLLQWNPEELKQSPLFSPLHSLLSHFENNHFPSLPDLDTLRGLQTEIKLQSGKSLRFVEQGLGKQVFESQYEPRCYLSGEVQTREHNLHDLFNALVWLTFPQSKAAINARHYCALTQAVSSLQSQRGSVRDMATLFDESGVIIACSNSHLAKLLCDFKWKELLWSCRDEVTAQMGFYIFGHGLYEKAIQPYVGITGQGLLLPVEKEYFTWSMARKIQHLDERVSAYINDDTHCLDTRELTPVPLLGVPGWSTDNMREEYYDNQHYFRAGRRGDNLESNLVK